MFRVCCLGSPSELCPRISARQICLAVPIGGIDLGAAPMTGEAVKRFRHQRTLPSWPESRVRSARKHSCEELRANCASRFCCPHRSRLLRFLSQINARHGPPGLFCGRSETGLPSASRREAPVDDNHSSPNAAIDLACRLWGPWLSMCRIGALLLIES